MLPDFRLDLTRSKRHSACSALAVEFDHIENAIAVLPPIEEGVASWRLQKGLFREADLGRQLKTFRKVSAELLATLKCSVWPTPTSNNCWSNKVDIFGVARDDPVKVPGIPSG